MPGRLGKLHSDPGLAAVFAGAVEIGDTQRPGAPPVRLDAGMAFDLAAAEPVALDGLEQGLDRGQWIFIDLTLATAVGELEREWSRPIYLTGDSGEARLPRLILPDRDVPAALERICGELTLTCTDLGPLGYLIRR